MIENLPEEILHEILKPLFHVTSEDFRLVALEPPSDQPPWQFPELLRLPRSPSTLLVCKQWLRAATPLFYQSLEVRSDGAMEGLANKLLAAPHLGRYIRRLRLAGAYGRSLDVIAKNSSNIQELSIQWDAVFPVTRDRS